MHRPFTPLLWIATAVLLGQWMAPSTAGWALPAAALTAAACCLGRDPHGATARLIAAAAVALAFGHRLLDARLHPALPASHIAAIGVDHALLRGTVEDPPAVRSGGLRFTMRVEAVRRGGGWQDASGRVVLTARRAERDWQRGDRLILRARLRPPRNFGNPGEFDYEHYLARRAIYTTGYADCDREWQRLPRVHPPDWRDTLRRHARATLQEVAPPHVRPIAAALLLGDGASLPPEMRRTYARAGVSHLLAISGLHIGLVAGTGYGICRWLLGRCEFALLRWNVPKLATAVAMPPVLAYAAVAGASAATLRATVMAVVFLSALLLDRSRHWPTAIAAAAAAVCISAPGALFEASFQLSFAAVIAIVAGGRRVRDGYDRWAERRLLRLTTPRWLAIERALVLSQSITVLALLATAPLTLLHFQQLSLVGMVSNLVIVPVTGVAAVSIGLTAVLINPLAPGMGGVLFAACSAAIALGDTATTAFANLPGADLQLPTPGWTEIAVYYALLACTLLQPGRGRRVLLATACAAASLQTATWWVERHGEELRVTFLSVGQGDCTLVEFPGGATMLVDGGGISPTFDVGTRVVAPALSRRMLRRLDVIVLTHPDFDHYGGLPTIVDRFRPTEFWSNGSHGSGRRYDDFHRRIAAADIRQVHAQRGYARSFGGVEVRVLHPPPGSSRPHNDDSIVLRITYAGVSFLLTGDVEHGGERHLARTAGGLRTSVLQVPHHGSRTSSTDTLLDAAQPDIAVISSGHRNRYNLPHPAVVERYEQRGVDVLRTARDGAIEFRIAPRGGGSLLTGQRWRRWHHLQAVTGGGLRALAPPPPFHFVAVAGETA